VLAGDGDAVRLRVRETSDWLRLAGLPELVHEPCELRRRGGLVAAVDSRLDRPSAEAYHRAWQLLAGWMQRNLPAEFRRLAPGGSIVLDRDSAGRWLALLRRRQKSGGR
jgi:hypothetical protein